MNIEKIREDFPVTSKIIYMDSSCVSLKPIQVINAITEYNTEYPACGGRSNHRLGIKVTEKIEDSRRAVSKFFSTKKTEEIIFTKNTTEAINIVANGLNFQKGEKVLISDKEHNSNLVPWLILKKRKGINLEIYEFGNMKDCSKKAEGARLISTTATSNLDGSSQDIKELVKIARKNNTLILIDAAQAAAHHEINVKKLDIDFLAASGHKMLGASGTGILYGKMEELEKLETYTTGGETVRDTTYDSYEIDKIPHRFEAGLQNYAGIISLKEAAEYLSEIGFKEIEKHEKKLNKIITEGIKEIPGLKILGPEDPEDRSGIVSFTVEGLDPHDIALQLDSSANIMIRSGYHCCHSWLNANNIKGSARASLYIYNTEEEAQKFVEALKQTINLLK